MAEEIIGGQTTSESGQILQRRKPSIYFWLMAAVFILAGITETYSQLTTTVPVHVPTGTIINGATTLLPGTNYVPATFANNGRNIMLSILATAFGIVQMGVLVRRQFF